MGQESGLGSEDQSLSSQDFRKAMGLFATGVAVLVVQPPGSDPIGMTANAIASVSLDPVLLLVCVEKAANIARALLDAPVFSLSFLSDAQEPLSDYFAGRWQGDPPPFSFDEWDGGLVLKGCLASVVCRKSDVIEGGDHWIVEGDVIALHRRPEAGDPLMFYASGYQHLAPDQG